MKATIVTRISINAKAPDVFEYLSNRKYHYLWNPQIRNISSTKPLKLGEVYTTESTVLGMTISATNVVTRFTPPKEMELENNTGMVKYRANFKLVTQAGKTILTCTTTVDSDTKAFGFTVPILKKLAQRELQTDMQALKIAVEHRIGADE